MSSKKHRQKGYVKGCALLLMGCFLVNAQPLPIFGQEKIEIYSFITLQEGQSLEELAKRYQTTKDQIVLDNSKLTITPGVTLTIREKTIQEEPVVVEALSRGRSLAWSWPVYAPISSGYGSRKGGFHHGVDFAIPHGTDIVAAREGKVAKTLNHSIYGLTVILDHGNGVQSLYAHNQKLLVMPGDWVKQGECIAISGDTGRSTGPHLHFEIRLNQKAVDPMQFYLYK